LPHGKTEKLQNGGKAMAIKITEKVTTMISKLEKVLSYKPKSIKPEESKEDNFWKPKSNTNVWTIYQRAAEQGWADNPYVNKRIIENCYYACKFAINVKRKRWPELEKFIEDNNFFIEKEFPGDFKAYLKNLEITNWVNFEQAVISYLVKEIKENKAHVHLDKKIHLLQLLEAYLINNPHVKKVFLKLVRVMFLKVSKKIQSYVSPQGAYSSELNERKHHQIELIRLIYDNFEKTDKSIDKAILGRVQTLINYAKIMERRNSNNIDCADWRLSLDDQCSLETFKDYAIKFKNNNWKELEDLLFGDVEQRYGIMLHWHIYSDKRMPEELEEYIFSCLTTRTKTIYDQYNADRNVIIIDSWNYRAWSFPKSSLINKLLYYVEKCVKNRCKGFEEFALTFENDQIFNRYLVVLKSLIKSGQKMSQL